MAGSLSPGSPVALPATLTVPADGDLANAASVNVAFQAILTGLEGARLGLYGRGQHGPRVVSFDGENLTVSPLGYLLVTSGGTWRMISYTLSSSFSAATKLGAGLANSTRYYVYAGIVAGSADFIVTTDAPDSYRAYRTGNTDHIYVSTFVTNGSAKIIPFTQNGRRYTYAMPYHVAALSGGTATVATDVLLSAYVPSWVRVATIQAVAYNPNGGGADTLFLKPKGVTATGFTLGFAHYFTATAQTDQFDTTHDICLDAAQTIQYYLSSGGAGCSVTLRVVGWDET